MASKNTLTISFPTGGLTPSEEDLKLIQIQCLDHIEDVVTKQSPTSEDTEFAQLSCQLLGKMLIALPFIAVKEIVLNINDLDSASGIVNGLKKPVTLMTVKGMALSINEAKE